MSPRVVLGSRLASRFGHDCFSKDGRDGGC
jgi:hypothetical protein